MESDLAYSWDQAEVNSIVDSGGTRALRNPTSPGRWIESLQQRQGRYDKLFAHRVRVHNIAQRHNEPTS